MDARASASNTSESFGIGRLVVETWKRGNWTTPHAALDEGHKNVQSKGNNENTCAQPAGYYENTCTPGRHVAHGAEEMVGRTNKTSCNCYLLKDLETDGC